MITLSRYATLAALATLGLLVAGGLISITESGLACPDWPLCEGRYIPPMIDGKQFEHTHRLIASFVGVMTFGLAALIFKHRSGDRLLKTLGVAAVLLVIAQALLGALTVKLALPAWVSSAHLATALVFFSVMVSFPFLITQRSVSNPGLRLPEEVPGSVQALQRFTWGVVGLSYLQLVLGGVMRHTRAGLACGFDFPRCLGQWWPADGYFGIQIHMLHRVTGALVGFAVVALSVWLWRAARGHRMLRALAASLTLAVLGQIALGIATILSSRGPVVMTMHSTLGAALLANLIAVHWLAFPIKTVTPAPRRMQSVLIKTPAWEPS